MKYILVTSFLILAMHVAQCGAQVPASAQPSETQPSAQTISLSGKVVETTNAGPYTYFLINTGTNKVWIAAPKTEVKVGDSVLMAQGMPMPHFHSATLNRDFELIYFAGSVVVNGTQPAAGAGAAALPKNHPPITGAFAPTKMDFSGIKKAEGGKTVEEILASKADVNGQQVKVRGRVVKYNQMILGKNWVHLRDGTGDQGNNDLVVTTASEVKVGDTVLVTGSISINKDFGSGYRYAVMIEDAKVTVE